MAKEFLGRGWKFPVKADPRGSMEVSQYEDDVREALGIILGTSRGERVMLPDFGCGLHDLVFSVLNTSTMGSIREAVRDALVTWEPRVELKNVDVTLDEAAEGRVLINIKYIIRTTNNEFNLVYPFYLKE